MSTTIPSTLQALADRVRALAPALAVSVDLNGVDVRGGTQRLVIWRERGSDSAGWAYRIGPCSANNEGDIDDEQGLRAVLDEVQL